jgi:AcrR family transcriptional regulator
VAGGREQLIDTAERLFAERGIAAVSLREIGAASGHRNNSAAQYHFGTREGLVDAIFETRMGPIDEARRAMLEQHEADGRLTDVRALCEAFIHPLAASLVSSGGASWYARFLSQVVFDPEFELLAHRRYPVTHGLRRTIDLLDATMTDLPPVLRGERLQLAASLVVHSLADRERAAQAGRLAPGATPALLAADLVDVMHAVLVAPVSDAVRKELRTAARHSA